MFPDVLCQSTFRKHTNFVKIIPLTVRHEKFFFCQKSVKRSVYDREIPLCTLRKKRVKASFTVEAALVLPLFVMALAAVLYLFEMQLLQQKVKEGLHNAAQTLAVAAYAETMDSDEATGEAVRFGIDSVSAYYMVAEAVDDDVLSSIVVGKKYGIITTSDTSDDDFITLYADYAVKIPLVPLAAGTFVLHDKAVARKWTGYDSSSGDTEEEIVYITPTGEVYHKDRECTYLNPSISSVSFEEISNLRNAGGGKYYPCEICVSEGNLFSVYITDYGSAYHSSVTCSGLKRTVYCVPLSTVSDRRPCSKCGGK